MVDKTFMFTWLAGVGFFLAAIPLLPRREVRTPLHAMGTVIVFGAVWPLLVLVAIGHFAPWWYGLKWVEYLEFLDETKAECIQVEFQQKWDSFDAEKFPDAYRRAKVQLASELDVLATKANKWYSRKRYFENKLRVRNLL